MEYSDSFKKVYSFVNMANRKKFRNNSKPAPAQRIPLDEQTKNDFELEHGTSLKDTMIYLDPDYNYHFFLRRTALAYAVANEIHIKKSKYNPGSTETNEIIEHELTHVQQYSENRQDAPVDELELEARFNETRRFRNGEEVRYIEYEKGKYCEVTPAEYRKLLDKIATEFEFRVESTILGMNDEEQLKFLIALQEWSRDSSKEPIAHYIRW